MNWRDGPHHLSKKQERIFLWILVGLILLMLLLAGCATAPTVQVTWQMYDTQEDLKKFCGNQNTACAKYNLDKKTCTIHTTYPVNNWILGHEVCHCFKGQTHVELPAGTKPSDLSGATKQTFNMCGV